MGEWKGRSGTRQASARRSEAQGAREGSEPRRGRAAEAEVRGQRVEPLQVGVAARHPRLVWPLHHRDLERGRSECAQQRARAGGGAGEDAQAAHGEERTGRPRPRGDGGHARLQCEQAGAGGGGDLPDPVAGDDVRTGSALGQEPRGQDAAHVRDDVRQVRMPAEVLDGAVGIEQGREPRSEDLAGDLAGSGEKRARRRVHPQHASEQARVDAIRGEGEDERARRPLGDGTAQAAGPGSRRRLPAAPDDLGVEQRGHPEAGGDALRERRGPERLAQGPGVAHQGGGKGTNLAAVAGQAHELLEAARHRRPVAAHDAEAAAHRRRGDILVRHEDPDGVAEGDGGEVAAVALVHEQDQVRALRARLRRVEDVREEEVLARLALEAEVREEMVPVGRLGVREEDAVGPGEEAHRLGRHATSATGEGTARADA
jgi:hypothetical protein